VVGLGSVSLSVPFRQVTPAYGATWALTRPVRLHETSMCQKQTPRITSRAVALMWMRIRLCRGCHLGPIRRRCAHKEAHVGYYEPKAPARSALPADLVNSFEAYCMVAITILFGRQARGRPFVMVFSKKLWRYTLP